MKNKNRKQRISKDGFTQVPNTILFNDSLTVGEKGMLAEFISNPPKWKTYRKELFGRSAGGYRPQNLILNSLKKKGFLIEKGARNEMGQFQYEYYVNYKAIESTPDNTQAEQVITNETPIPHNPLSVEPDTVKPHTVEPITVNGQVSNTDTISNTDINNTNEEVILSISKTQEKKQEVEKEFVPPDRQEVIQFFKSKGYDNAIAFAFYKEFEGRNWYSIKGEKISNWKGMATHFVNTKGSTFFVIPEEEKTKMYKLAGGLYDLIAPKNHTKAMQTGNFAMTNYSKSDVKEWMLQLAHEKGISTAIELKGYIKSIKPSTMSFYEFKKSIGLTDSGSSGKRYV